MRPIKAIEKKLSGRYTVHITVLSLMSAFLPLLLVKTLLMKIAYVLFTFVSVFLLLWIISNNKVVTIYLNMPSVLREFRKTSKLRARNHSCLCTLGRKTRFFKILLSCFLGSKSTHSVVLYVLGLFTSIIVMFVPSIGIHVNPRWVWTTYTSLSSISLSRVISGYFLVSVFPGAAIYLCFMKKYELESFEKIGLILALSYCHSVLSGLLLLYFSVFSSSFFILLLWLPVFSVNVFRYFSKKKEALSEASGSSSLIDSNSLILFLMGSVFVIFSYLLVLFIGPFTGITSGDVIQYMNVANTFVNGGPFVRDPYVWSNVFWWVTGSITGLPMFYAYAGSQFYQLLLPSSFYMLVRTVFSGKRKVASIASFMLFFANGVTSLLMLGLSTVSPNIFKMYLGEDTVNVLDYFFTRTGSPGLTPLSTGVGTFGTSLVFFALALAYQYLLGNDKAISSLLLSGLFACASFFTHGINFVPVFFGTILIFSLLHDVPKRTLGKLMLLTIILTFLLDPLSKFLLCRIWLPWTFLPISETIYDIRIFALVLIGVTVYVFLLIFRERFRNGLRGFLSARLSVLFIKNSVTAVFWFVGILVFLVSVCIYLVDYESIEYTRIWYQQDYLFPWYYVIFRSYGVAFPLAIGGTAYLYKKSQKEISAFIVSWLLSTLSFIAATLIFPAVLPPSIFYTRYSIFLICPLSILAALGLENARFFSEASVALTHVQRAKLKYALSFSLVFLVSLSFLSHAYSRELFFLYGQGQDMTYEFAEGIEWMNNNIPSNSKILPLSESMGSSISNLVSTMRVLPITNLYSSTWLPYSWLRDILFRSASPEVVLWALSSLGVSYIVARSSDIPNLRTEFNESAFFSVLNCFPISFENDEMKIYAVPRYHVYADSNFVLVYPTLQVPSPSLEVAFNMLIASGINFSIINDVDLDESRPNYVYIFPHEEDLPGQIFEKTSRFIANGAHVILLNPLSILNSTTQPTMIEPPTTVMNGEADIGGGFVYQFRPLRPLNLTGQEFIEVWFKSSSPGNFFFGIFEDDEHNKVWSGKCDARYKIVPKDTNQWKKMVLPLQTPTFDNEMLNLTNVVYIRIGIDGLPPEQNVNLNIKDIRVLAGTSEIEFDDGTVFSFDKIPIGQLTFTKVSQILGSFLLTDGSQTPYILQEQIGHGSLTFIDSSPLLNLRYSKVYSELLQRTVRNIRAWLPEPNSPEKMYSLPYNPDLYIQIVPSLLGLRYLEGLHNTLLYYNDIEISGDVIIETGDILVTDKNISVEKIILQNPNSELIIENSNISNLSVHGLGVLYSNSSSMKIENKPTGSYVILNIHNFKSFELALSNADIMFEAEINGEEQEFSLSNSNATILFRNALTMLVKQPTVMVDGAVGGILQGVIFHKDLFFYVPQEYVEATITGRFNLNVLYSSGFIYCKAANIHDIVVVEKD